MAEVIKLPIIARHLGPLLERHKRSIEVLRERAEALDAVVFFDVSDLDFEGYNKFIPYLLFPQCRYSVGISASATRAKISIGSNPSNPGDAEKNLASLAERFGGGGQPRVATISLNPSEITRAREVEHQVPEQLP